MLSRFQLTHLYEMWLNGTRNWMERSKFQLTHLYEMWPERVIIHHLVCDFNSHISMRCDAETERDHGRLVHFNSHISMRCDRYGEGRKAHGQNFNSHISMRCDGSADTIHLSPTTFQLTHLYEMWPLYMVRDNFQTTKYSNSKQNIVKLITKVSKIIAKRLIFSAKALEKKASLQVRHNVFKCVFCLFKILRYYKLL